MRNDNLNPDIDKIIRDEFKMIDSTFTDKDDKAVQSVVQRLEKKPFYNDLFDLIFIIPGKIINSIIGILIKGFQNIHKDKHSS